MARFSMIQISTIILSLIYYSLASTIIARSPTVPSQDPFYTPPDGYESQPPGTILRHRKPPYPLAAFGTIPLPLREAYQILYRTTTSRGHPSTTVTTVLIPENANNQRLVSYQDLMDASFLDCSSSYALQLSSSYGTLLSQVSPIYIATLLEYGYFVSIPDYEGSRAAFASGVGSGYALLDSVRAVLASSNFTGIARDSVDVGFWGYSGGSIPTEWATELQSVYAPELKIMGAAMGGSIVNVTSTVFTLNKGGSAGFAPAGIIGIRSDYPELGTFLKDLLVSETLDEFEKAGKQCAEANFNTFRNKDIGQYFKGGLEFFRSEEVVKIINETGVMGLRGTPSIPLYIYKSVEDKTCPIENDDALVKRYCENGGKVEYERNSRGSHSTESFLGAPGALEFLKDLFEGKQRANGCQTRNVDIITPDYKTFSIVGDGVVANMMELFGKALGIDGESLDDVEKNIGKQAEKKLDGIAKDIKSMFGHFFGGA